METNLVPALLIFLFPLAYSPGPGNMFFAATGARFGMRSTLGATTGYHIATFLVTLPIGLGFSSVLDTAPEVFITIKIVGSVYVMWLAWKLFKAGTQEGQEHAKPASFLGGAVLLIFNPKAYVLIALMFSQFLTTTSGLAEIAIISIVFTLNNLVAFTIWTAVGDRLARAFRNEQQAKYLNMFFGGVLGMVGIWMLAY